MKKFTVFVRGVGGIEVVFVHVSGNTLPVSGTEKSVELRAKTQGSVVEVIDAEKNNGTDKNDRNNEKHRFCLFHKNNLPMLKKPK